MSNADYWKSSIRAAARAQNALLWVLLGLGVFYWSLGNPALDLPPSQTKPVMVPVVGLDLPRVAVWATAPAVLFFILLAVDGTIRVCNHALAELKKVAPKDKEPDLEPNALDYVIRTTDASPLLLKNVLSFAYAAYLALFVIEASSLTLDFAAVAGAVPVPGRYVLLPLAVTEGAVVWVRTYLFWRGRLKKAVDQWKEQLRRRRTDMHPTQPARTQKD